MCWQKVSNLTLYIRVLEFASTNVPTVQSVNKSLAVQCTAKAADPNIWTLDTQWTAPLPQALIKMYSAATVQHKTLIY